MLIPNTYNGGKWIYLIVLISFQSVFLQNVCRSQFFHWARNYNEEAQELKALFGQDKELTSIHKVFEVTVV